MGIMSLLAAEAMTNEELARKLGVASGALHFHTRFLRDAGIIDVAYTRRNGPQTEKYYRPVAKVYEYELKLDVKESG